MAGANTLVFGDGDAVWIPDCCGVKYVAVWVTYMTAGGLQLWKRVYLRRDTANWTGPPYSTACIGNCCGCVAVPQAFIFNPGLLLNGGCTDCSFYSGDQIIVKVPGFCQWRSVQTNECELCGFDLCPDGNLSAWEFSCQTTHWELQPVRGAQLGARMKWTGSITWDCTSALTLTREGDLHDICTGWPNTITLSPIF